MKNTNAMERFVNANKNQNVLNIMNENNKTAKRVLSDLNVIRDLKAKEDGTIDLTDALNAMGILAKLGYAPGSKIGIIISLTCVCEALKDKDLNKQFLAAGSEDVVDLHKLSLVFPYVGQAGTLNEGYKTVFLPEHHAIVTDKLGRTQTVLLAAKDRIAEFSQAIRECGMLHIDDLVTIGRDLEIVSTVMSELEIDAAKDEKKREGMIDISDFMNEYMTQNSRSFGVINNFSELKENKDNNSEKEVVLSQTINTGKSLFQYEEVLAELIEERQAQLDAGEAPTFEEHELESVALGRCSVMDPLFALVQAVLEATNSQMETLGKLYKTSNMDLFKGFDIMPERNEEANKHQNETVTQSVVAIKKAAILVYSMINSVYKYKGYMSMCKVEDLAAMGRNIIYTMAQDRGIELSDAFYLAVDAAWLRIDNKGNLANRGYFAYRACEAVFSNELKCHFNSKAMSKEVDIEIPEELFEVEDLFENNRIFNFENGSCEVQGVDGEYYSMFRIDNDEFTGKVLVEIDEEGYLTFLEALNPYEFERVDFFMLDSIANMTIDANKVNAEQLAGLVAAENNGDKFAFHKAYNNSKVVDKNKAFAKEAELLKFANQVEPVIATFDNLVKFPVTMAQRFSLVPSKGRSHLYMKDATDGAARFIGSLAQVRLSKKLKDCTDLRAMTTPVGSIIIVK